MDNDPQSYTLKLVKDLARINTLKLALLIEKNARNGQFYVVIIG
jgi:hypothetical protein